MLNDSGYKLFKTETSPSNNSCLTDGTGDGQYVTQTFIVIFMQKRLYNKGCWIKTVWKATSSCYLKGKHQHVSHLCSASLLLPFPFSLGTNAILQQRSSADPGEANVSFPDGKLPAWWCHAERHWGNSLCCRSKRTSLPNTPWVHARFRTADEVARKVLAALLKCLFR